MPPRAFPLVMCFVERSGKEFKAYVYKRKEKESRQRDIELEYDEDTFEEIRI